MTAVRFTVYGVAAPQGSKVRTRHGGMRESSKRLAPWRAQVSLSAAQEMAHGFRTSLLDGPLRARILFVLPRPKSHFGTGKRADVLKLSAPVYPSVTPDLDKCCRAIFDSLTGVVFRDDAQVASLVAEKRYGAPARVEVTVEPLEDARACAEAGAA